MDTFSWDSWDVDAIIEAGGGFYTWAGNQGMINFLTVIAVAVFLLSMVHMIRSEDRHLTSVAADLAAASAASDLSSGGE
jgi:uncharacterized membrane protein